MLTEEKSQEFAGVLLAINMPLHMVDVDYAKEVAKGMMEHASYIDSCAALNQNYDPTATELIRTQALAVRDLIQYIERLREIDKLKVRVGTNTAHRDTMAKIFA